MESSAFKISYLGQEESKKLDDELIGDFAHPSEILMEIAGQSVAHAIYHCDHKYHSGGFKKILIISGPGNNGGDGYVSARHLTHLGYEIDVLYTKKPEKDHLLNLVKACEANGIRMIDYSKDAEMAQNFEEKVNGYNLIVDGIFGYSFKGPMREPYGKIIQTLKTVKPPIFSIDLPSGWDIEKGNVDDLFDPQYTISLSLPKKCMEKYKGVHYLGGRFLPKKMVEKYGWAVPAYKGLDTFIELPKD